MRFAFLHHDNPLSESLWSGIPLNIVRTLRELGHEVVVIGPLDPQSPISGRIKTQIYRHLFKKQYLINRDPHVARLRAEDGNRRLRNAGPMDAVLITFPPNAAFLETSDPVLLIHDATWMQLLDFYPGYERRAFAEETLHGGTELDQKALSRCDRAIFCSSWAASSAIHDFSVTPEKVSVAPLGANIVSPPTRDNVASYLLLRGKGPMKLFFLGKEWHRKGGDIAIQVATEIEHRGLPVELHVAGCDPQGEIPSFVYRHGLLHKDVPQEAEKLQELFASSDFFIMPSRADAFGIAIAEAAAFGLPVMACDTGGVREVARREWSIAPPLDSSPAVYADWATRVFRDRADYERRSWLARESYENDLNWPAFCRHLVNVVQEIKSNPARIRPEVIAAV
jgi:glycosyltransferase involved in cell wall biosynthesis